MVFYALSNRLMTEDILHELGYVLLQSDEARELLESMLENSVTNKDEFSFVAIENHEI